MTRPSYEPSAKDRMMVGVMVAGGIDQAAISAVLGISRPTLRKHFRHEIDSASTAANAAVVASLYRMATTGRNVAAAIYWTKARMGWRERLIVQGDGDAFGFSTVVNVLEQRRKELADASVSED